MASFRSFQYSLRLLEHECWEAVRLWNRHQPIAQLTCYAAGREWLAIGRFEAARDAFLHAEGAAEKVVGNLQGTCSDIGSSGVAYSVHVAELFASYQGDLQDEYTFLKKAAILAETPGGDGLLGQRLWSEIFRKAVDLERWEEACEALLRIESFESCIRLLGQKVRGSGRIDLMLQLPEPHREYFINNLHEQASQRPPVGSESDSLACYQHIYALHFASGDWLKAAATAHTMYSALDASLEVPHSSTTTAVTSAIVQNEGIPGDVSKLAQHNLWPILQQQRDALLMLISALTMAPEQMILVPSVGDTASSALGGNARSAPGGTVPSPYMAAHAELSDFRSWFSEAAQKAHATAFSITDASRLLAMTEARMILSGKGEIDSPAEVARSIAAIGLLGLALQVVEFCNLDPWQCAFQPFVRLCVESTACSEENIRSLVDAARGPTQSHMFMHSDGQEALGTFGSAKRGLWQMLEEGLRAMSGIEPEGSKLSATSARLYSCVADEILSVQQSSKGLPGFIRRILSHSHFWVCLLRLFLKHERIDDAVELLGEKLKTCKLQEDAESPMQDFPVCLIVQLKRHVCRKSDEIRLNQVSEGTSQKLEEILSQFRCSLEDSERRIEQRL